MDVPRSLSESQSCAGDENSVHPKESDVSKESSRREPLSSSLQTASIRRKKKKLYDFFLSPLQDLAKDSVQLWSSNKK